MQRTVAAFILILVLISAAICANGQQKEIGASEIWRVKSQTLTDDLLKDASQLSSNRRAVVLARLAQRWSTDDPEHARKWFQNAIELVEQAPNKETADERRERIAAARIVLKNVARFDQGLTMRLVKVLTPNRQTSKDERSANAEWLMNSATDLVAVDTTRANELAGAALRIGPPNDLASFLLAMRRKDAKLADAMFTQALSFAKQQPFPVQLLNTLAYAAFPMARGWAGSLPPLPSENLQSELLQAEINFLNANPINEDNRGSMCSCVSGFIAPLAGEFDRLLPTESVVVQQAITRCEPMLGRQPNDQSPSSAEDFLQAAAVEKNERVRTTYEHRAATSAYAAKDYDLAFRILDGMTKEQRKYMGGSWESLRWEWAAQAAIEYYQHGRLDEMNVVLNSVPPNVQPIAKIAFLGRLREPKDVESAPLLQVLNDALIELRRSTMPDLDKYNWYLAALPSTVKYQSADASGVLKAAVSSLNKARDRKTLETADFADGIAEPLLAMDEYVVKDNVASITLVETRANLRLVLLGATLRRMKSAGSVSN
jgi:hypothetical protein